MAKRKTFWIKDALKGHKKGSLHRQLGVPMDKTITKSLLNKIKRTEIGKTVKNPTRTGKRRIKVTRLMKKRSVLAHTLRGFK